MKTLLLELISFYQKHISQTMLPRCRYFPSCSEYAAEAIKKYGILAGAAKSIWRLLRCNPFSGGGLDVP